MRVSFFIRCANTTAISAFERHNPTSAAPLNESRNDSQNEDVGSGQKRRTACSLVSADGESSRDHLLLICRATVPALIVLMTAVNCSAPAADMPEPRHRVIEREPPPSRRWTNEESRRLVQQRLDRQSILRPEQQGASALSRVAKVRAPDTTGASLSHRILQQPNPPRRLDAAEKERLFQEFLEWQRRQGDMP
jgi:hypothetical protein